MWGIGIVPVATLKHNVNVSIERALKPLIFFIFVLALLLLSVYFPTMGFKGVLIASLTVAMVIMAAIPMRWALFICLIYIGFEGFFKIFSDYNPLIHVGSDLLVVFLSLRVLVQVFARGNPLPHYFPPLIALFVFHFIWVIITLFNPYSLGAVASIAGSKIYVTMPLLFFFAYYNTESIEDIQFFLKAVLFVAIMHTIFGLYQGIVGPESVLSLHPRYAIQLEKYRDTAFRPFGLTNLPGGPAVYLAPVIPFALYMALVYRHFLRWFLLSFCAAATSLVLLCQVRSALLKLILGVVLFVISYTAVAVRLRSRMRFGMATIVLASLFLTFLTPKFVNYVLDSNEQNQNAIERSLSLFDINKISSARRGTWERFYQYLQDVPFGAGFARVGAAGGAFQHLQADDPFFKTNYFFADNFWIASLVEVGIPGMVILTLLVGAILILGYSKQRKLANPDYKLVMLSLLAGLVPLVVGLYASEGILYNPDASFFWFFSGAMLKIPHIEKNSHISGDQATEGTFYEYD